MIYYGSISLFLAIVFVYCLRHVRWWIAIPVAYLGLVPLFWFTFPKLHLPISPVMEQSMQRQDLLWFIGIWMIGVCGTSKESSYRLKLFIQCLALFETILLIIYKQGIFGNGAQGICFVILAAPIFMQGNWWKLFFILTIGAILQTKSATAFLMLSVYSVLLRWWMVIPFALAGGVLYRIDPMFWHSSGRDTIWHESISFLFNGFHSSFFNMEGDPWFGFGPGHFFFYGPSLAHLIGGDTSQVFTWLHNDYLEIFFGYGAVGLFFFLWLLLVAGTMARKHFETLALFCAFLVLMCFQMPLSQPIYWLMIIYFVRRLNENIQVQKSQDGCG